MAHYHYDFADQTVGTEPSTVKPIATYDLSVMVVDTVIGANGGKSVEIKRLNTANDRPWRRFDSWNQGSIDTLMRFQRTSALVTPILGVRASNDGCVALTYDNNNMQLQINLIPLLKLTNKTILATAPLANMGDANQWYWLRFKAVDGNLMGKMWEDGSYEPEGWQITATYNHLTAYTNSDRGYVAVSCSAIDVINYVDVVAYATNADAHSPYLTYPYPTIASKASITSSSQLSFTAKIKSALSESTSQATAGLLLYPHRMISSALAQTYSDATLMIDLITGDSGYLRGNVLKDGVGVKGAIIKVVHENNVNVYETVTDALGRYEVWCEIAGTYTLFCYYQDESGNKFTSQTKPFINVGVG